jgi:subtilisin family serine protease
MRRSFIYCCGISTLGLLAPALPAPQRVGSRWKAYGLACLLLAAVPVWGDAGTTEILVRLAPGADARAFAHEQKLEFLYTLRSDPDMHVVKAGSALEAEKVVASRNSSAPKAGAVVGANPLQDAWLNSVTRNAREAFVPNDPYFAANTPTNFPGQWHLNWLDHPDRDSRVQGAWNREVTGAGVTIGIVDDGLDTAHPDLAPNYVAGDSWNFGNDSPNPDPVYANDNHGTSVSGVAAARGGNGLGVTGAAPWARLAGLRVDFEGNSTVASFVDATKYHSFGTNRNIRVKNHSYGSSTPFDNESAERAALVESAGAGTIHCVSAGNSRNEPVEDSNRRGKSSSPCVINVAALASSGIFASYSGFGACVFVTAPSSSERTNELEITTTDRVGTNGYNNYKWPGNPFPDQDYTADFGGTSSATPLVAGIMALGVQANTNLEIRLAKHLLARSCDRVDPGDTTATSDGGWRTNGAGFWFNQNYGFGKINADRFTALARQYTGVTPEVVQGDEAPVSVGEVVPPGTNVSRTFTFANQSPLETVEMRLNFAATVLRDIEAYLTSPQGTRSRLLMSCAAGTSTAAASLTNWFLTSHAFFGENPAGTWTVTVLNKGDNEDATWTAYQFIAHMGQAIPAAPVILADSLRRRADGGFEFTFAGSAGQTYQVYASSNLQSWSQIQEVVLTLPTGLVVDSEVGLQQRFYRVGFR